MPWYEGYLETRNNQITYTTAPQWTSPQFVTVGVDRFVYNGTGASGYFPEQLLGESQEDEMTESTNRLPTPSGWPGQGPRELPTSRIPTVVTDQRVTFMLVGPQGDVVYEKLASSFGSSATIDERSKTRVAALIAHADQHDQCRLLVAWPGRTQDIFYVPREDYATLLEALGFTDAEATPITVGGKKWVLPK